MNTETKKLATDIMLKRNPRSVEEKLNDAYTARAHFAGTALRLEREAADKLEMAACFRVRVDELCDSIAALEAKIEAQNPAD